MEQFCGYKISDGRLFEKLKDANKAEEQLIASRKEKEINALIDKMLSVSCYGQYFITGKDYVYADKNDFKKKIQTLFSRDYALIKLLVEEIEYLIKHKNK